jgi:hypothetical protein
MRCAVVTYWFVLLFVTGGWAQTADLTTDYQAIAIGVYDYAHVPERVLAGAEWETASMFGRFGVHLIWGHCFDRRSIPPCSQLLGPRFVQLNLLDRIMGSKTTLDDRGLGATLGIKTIAVLYQPIQDTIGDEDPERSQILAHIFAHELGHILLPPKAHSDKGIMRPRWRLRDLENDISFTRREEDQIRGAVIALEAQHWPVGKVHSPR